MVKKLFDKKLNFEINVIGYKNKGESIVFFLKADGKAIYAGLIDCYEEASENIALKLLEGEMVNYFNFVCWTHPHDDHTIGLDKVLINFCDENTKFYMPPFVLGDVEGYSSNAQNVYRKLFAVLESRKRNKMKIREASDAQILEKFECCGNASIYPYIFEIRSFAPDTMLLGKLKVKERFDKGNVYSIGLVVNVGHFYVVLAGDVENQTIKYIPDFNFDINDRIDYVKIPHHASPTASYLIEKFNSLDIGAPAVAATTVYRIHNLPNKEILKKYVMWGDNIEVYSTGNVENAEMDNESSGVIKTSFDILEQEEIPIKTLLYGNAVCVSVK